MCALALAAGLASCDGAGEGVGGDELVIGGLFSRTGNWNTLGRNAEVALELAVADANVALADNGSDLRVRAEVVDTRLDPQGALAGLNQLIAGGARFVVGPQSSAEVAALKATADAAGVLLLSPSSTAGSLAIAGDNVFRFTPSDGPEGEAIAALMQADGVRAVVPVWRDDAGNSGLEAATRRAFTALGGTVTTGVRYGATTSDFSATVASLRTDVSAAQAQVGAGNVAVYLAAFDEVVGLFRRAQSDPVLSSVRWYGSDGVALSTALSGDAQAAAFAVRSGYPNPVFGLDPAAAPLAAPLLARIEARTGIAPDAFALAVYDAARVAVQAYVAARAAPEPAALRVYLAQAANAYFGATGWTALNEAGDRRYGVFDFWALRAGTPAPVWTRVAQYHPASRRLTRL